MYKFRNMPHIKATMQSEYKIVYEDTKTLIVYNIRADTYIAEGLTDIIIDRLKTFKIERLETSNREVFEYFKSTKNFKYQQICLQCYHKSSKGTANLDLPNLEEIKWIAETYGASVDDIANMVKGNKIFVYRENGEAISYVGIHIDGSVGFLYTKPKYIRQGYATKIEEQLFKIKKQPIFSQIMEDNIISINFHKKNNWKFNRYKIYWLFNQAF